MTTAQVINALARHDDIAHDLESPSWNLASALLLHRKIELQARAFTRRRRELRSAWKAPPKTSPWSGKT